MTTSGKIITLDQAVRIARTAEKQGLSVVTTSGCYDILHAGHIETLEWAKSQGDLLLVGLDSDAGVRANKGPERPIISERERARVLAGLAAVDYVFIFTTDSPLPWLKQIKPKIHVKGEGSELDPRFAPEEQLIQKLGGRVLLAPKAHGHSSTAIVSKIIERYGK